MFTLAECHEYWFQYNDPNLYKALVTLESVESWTVEDNESVQASLSRLDQALKTLENKKGFDQYPLFVAATNPLKSSQIMRILQALNLSHPVQGAATKVIAHAESDTSVAENHTFVERNVAFERFRLMARIFSEQRIQKVLETIDKTSL